tara:strand:- start:253 stop:429 length:177 start_codon:yes stop_codon:yes gene_type:complete
MVFQDYELIPTKRVNKDRRMTKSIFFGRLFNASGSWPSVFYGSLAAYAYFLKGQMGGA